MNQAAREERIVNTVLLGGIFISGIVLVREGPYFDNVLDGWPFFTGAFFIGTLLGFASWSYNFQIKPSLKFSGTYRQPWLAAFLMGLLTTVSVSYINRSFAGPVERSMTANIEDVEEGKGERWHLVVKKTDGGYQRYLIPKPVADQLKNEKIVRLGISRGALGFDLITKFEPQK